MMHLITANEMETHLSIMKNEKKNFLESLEKWGAVIQENIHNKMPLLHFMEDCITHVTICQQYVSENKLEKDDQHFKSLLDFLATEGTKQNETVGKFMGFMKEVEQLAKDETEPKEELGKLVHLMEMYYFNVADASFYEFILAYNRGLLALYRYIRKIENQRSA